MSAAEIKDWLLLGAIGFAGYSVARIVLKTASVGESVADTLADAYTSLTLPEIKGAVLRLWSNYFLENGDIKPEALDVVKQYGDFYQIAFIGRKIKPEFAYLIDSNIPIVWDGKTLTIGK